LFGDFIISDVIYQCLLFFYYTPKKIIEPKEISTEESVFLFLLTFAFLST